MKEFAESLKELMSDKNINIKTLSERVGINASAISHYLNDTSTPTVENLIKIADYFSCTTEFLLGRANESTRSEFLPCPPFSERMRFLLKYFKSQPRDVYGQNGITKSRFYEWKNGSRQPSLDNLIKLADFFKCDTDFVLGR